MPAEVRRETRAASTRPRPLRPPRRPASRSTRAASRSVAPDGHHVIEEQDAAAGHRACAAERRRAGCDPARRRSASSAPRADERARTRAAPRSPARASEQPHRIEPAPAERRARPRYGTTSTPPGSGAAATTAAASAGARNRAASARPSRLSASITAARHPVVLEPGPHPQPVGHESRADLGHQLARGRRRRAPGRRHRTPRTRREAAPRAHRAPPRVSPPIHTPTLAEHTAPNGPCADQCRTLLLGREEGGVDAGVLPAGAAARTQHVALVIEHPSALERVAADDRDAAIQRVRGWCAARRCRTRRPR